MRVPVIPCSGPNSGNVATTGLGIVVLVVVFADDDVVHDLTVTARLKIVAVSSRTSRAITDEVVARPRSISERTEESIVMERH